MHKGRIYFRKQEKLVFFLNFWWLTVCVILQLFWNEVGSLQNHMTWNIASMTRVKMSVFFEKSKKRKIEIFRNFSTWNEVCPTRACMALNIASIARVEFIRVLRNFKKWNFSKFLMRERGELDVRMHDAWWCFDCLCGNELVFEKLLKIIFVYFWGLHQD